MIINWDLDVRLIFFFFFWRRKFKTELMHGRVNCQSYKDMYGIWVKSKKYRRNLGSGGRKSNQTLGSNSVGNVKWVPCDLYFGGEVPYR